MSSVVVFLRSTSSCSTCCSASVEIWSAVHSGSFRISSHFKQSLRECPTPEVQRKRQADVYGGKETDNGMWLEMAV